MTLYACAPALISTLQSTPTDIFPPDAFTVPVRRVPTPQMPPDAAEREGMVWSPDCWRTWSTKAEGGGGTGEGC